MRTPSTTRSRARLRTINDMTIQTCGIEGRSGPRARPPVGGERAAGPPGRGIRYGTGISATTYMSGARQLGHQSVRRS